MIVYSLLFPGDVAKWLVRLNDRGAYDEQHYVDAIHAAVSLGRLDIVSVALTLLAILLGLGAFFSFGYVRDRAEIVARQQANKEMVEINNRINDLEDQFRLPTVPSQEPAPDTSGAQEVRDDHDIQRTTGNHSEASR